MLGNQQVRFLWGLGPATDLGYQTAQPYQAADLIATENLACPQYAQVDDCQKNHGPLKEDN